MPKKKLNKAKGVLAFDVLNLVTQREVREQKDLTKLTKDYIPFGEAEENDFPQHLAELKRKSATHRAILAQKTIFTTGVGFNTEDESVLAYFENANAHGENFMSIWRKVIDDYYTFGNAYYEVVHYDGGVNIYHIDATKVRISKDQENVIIHADWDEYEQRKDEAEVIPFYPNFIKDKGNKRSVIHIKDYEPEFEYYGLPCYISALEDISVNYEIGRWNNTKFKNHFQPSSIVEINGDMSDEEAEALVEEARNKFTGEGNNGKILFLVKNGDTSPAQVTTLSDNSEGNFLQLANITNQNIITAHQWQPSLSGLVSAGKMNSTGSEIRIAYEMVMATVVKGTMHLLFEPIKQVLHDSGYEVEDLEVKYEPPISFMSDIKIDDVLEINELREVLGYEAKEGYDKLPNLTQTLWQHQLEQEAAEQELEDEKELMEEEAEIEEELIEKEQEQENED
ncbi:MAG: putative portal protein [Prokaryotic dsDNA virus sp.]|nr:MAG: putative portal protein [Prokaryotic dsDNA virus sp.]|tara:strand:+ start:55 stop:1410 length:1356 start_codon:yes stop_codon:yes gene_type:complete